MSEPIRNMLGFMSVFGALGLLSVGVVCLLARRRPPALLPLGFFAGMAVLGFAVFWVAGSLELPIAFIFTIPRIPNAKSVTGARVSEIVTNADAHWTTDDYFSWACGADHHNLTAVRLEVSGNTSDYYFALDSRTQVLVPLTEAAANTFPAFMPSGDKMVDVWTLNGRKDDFKTLTTIGNNELKLPAKWFRAATAPDGEQGKQ